MSQAALRAARVEADCDHEVGLWGVDGPGLYAAVLLASELERDPRPVGYVFLRRFGFCPRCGASVRAYWEEDVGPVS